ncbi:MAG: RNA 3'-terminal phosphate cyclase [Myxococcota bacterium]
MIEIDGSMGEGGGQILRTTLSLSLVTGRAARIVNIRAARPKPGLLRQHLASVRAAEAIGAQIEGAEIGASSLVVRPGPIRSGEHRIAIGSAGSTTLVAQTILPPLLLAEEPSRIVVEGGTHNPFAPTFDFFERVFLPRIRQMGMEVAAELGRPGFYPAGGGEIAFEVRPAGRPRPVSILERGPIASVQATALFANLPASIAERELETLRRRLRLEDPDLRMQEDPRSKGPGNVVQIEARFEGGAELFAGFAERRVRAEKVASRAAAEFERFVSADVPIGVRLADQLMIPMAMAGKGALRTMPLSEHGRTNLEVIRRFVETPMRVEEEAHSVVVEFG